MEKRKKIAIKIIVVVLVVVWIFWSIDNSDYESENKLYLEDNIERDSFSDIVEVHWTHMPLSFNITNKEDCDEYEINGILESFEIIQNSTAGAVSFIETETKPDITLYCINVEEELKKAEICKYITFNYKKSRFSAYEEGEINIDTHLFRRTNLIEMGDNKTVYELCYVDKNDIPFTATFDHTQGIILGEALPNYEGNKIINATIWIYHRNSRCADFPAIEVHELLHNFGFGHSYEPFFSPVFGWSNEDTIYLKDIMFPYSSCLHQKEIQQKYISCLKYIYSNGEFDGNCSGINFLNVGENFCENGWYPVEGTDFCCPEPNMEIINDYCT
ncbi:MAG: hypothetical protein ABIE36_01310 [Candidatus Diapherotrites archaeon]